MLVGLPSKDLAVSWHSHFQLCTPDTLKHCCRLPASKIHFADVCWELIMHQNWMLGCHQSRQLSNPWSVPFCNAFKVWSVIFRSIWLVQWWWRVFSIQNMAGTTPRWSNRALYLLIATVPHVNSSPKLVQIRRQIDINHNDYCSDPLEISSTF
jgi:hypothetical protein